MINLITHEWKVTRRSWRIALAVILLFIAMFAGMAETYMKNESMLETMRTLPPALLEGFGIDPNMMGSFEGWMGGEPHTFYLLLLGAFAVIWSATGIAKERDQQTGEYLFTLPYRRRHIFVAKAMAYFLQITVIYLLAFAAAYGIGEAVSTVEHPSVLFWLMTAGWLTALAFAGIGQAITVFLTSERAAMSLGIGIVLVSFLLNMLSGLNEGVRWLADFSLFHLFDAPSIVRENGLTWNGVWITLGIYAIGLGIGLSVLRRKDL